MISSNPDKPSVGSAAPAMENQVHPANFLLIFILGYIAIMALQSGATIPIHPYEDGSAKIEVKRNNPPLTAGLFFKIFHLVTPTLGVEFVAPECGIVGNVMLGGLPSFELPTGFPLLS